MLLGDSSYFFLFWVGHNNRLIHILNLTYLTYFFYSFSSFQCEVVFSFVPILSFLNWRGLVLDVWNGMNFVFFPLFFFTSIAALFHSRIFVFIVWDFVVWYRGFSGYCIVFFEPHTQCINAFLLDSRKKLKNQELHNQKRCNERQHSNKIKNWN